MHEILIRIYLLSSGVYTKRDTVLEIKFIGPEEMKRL